MKLLYIFLLLLRNFFTPNLADLPVHCLTKQITGSWSFFLSSLTPNRPSCGHQHPDRNTDHLKSDPKTSFERILKESSLKETLLLEKSIYMSLLLPNLIEGPLKEALGNWTMVYDEGFELRTFERTFFAFSRYSFNGDRGPKDTDDEDTNGYKSLCNETFIGWFREGSNGYWGCFYGVKTEDPIENNTKYNGNTVKNDGDKLKDGPLRFKGRKSFYSDSLYERFQQNEQLYEVPHKELLIGGSLDGNFNPDYRFIEYINDKKVKSPWKAKFHDDLMTNKTPKQMKTLLGLNEYKTYKYKVNFLQSNIEINYKPNKKPFELIEPIKNLENLKKNHYKTNSYLKKTTKKEIFSFKQPHIPMELPTNFDWRDYQGYNYDTPVKKQGDCGSCYALSTLSMLESRIRIKTQLKSAPFLSSSGALSCSPYNQGCNGGYPYLIVKEGLEKGFYEENCSPVLTDQHCEDRCFLKGNKIWKIKDYGYVGGFYGGCNEDLMRKEIFSNGPVVVAINAGPDLYYYSTGVFITNPSGIRKESNGGVAGNWMYTNHAVVCVGWGESLHEGKVIKYWILKNSWGEDWGEKGYFRILRGVNLAAVENQAVWGEPEV